MNQKTNMPLHLAESAEALRPSKRKQPRVGTALLVEGQECYQIPIGAQNEYVIVDAADYEEISKYYWGITRDYWNAYAIRHEYANGTSTAIRMHRQLLGFPVGEIDHKNHNGLDNRRCNIRVATTSQNQMNNRRKNKSGFRGVAQTYIARTNIWQASIIVNRKGIYLGRFATKEDAARAYDAAALRYHGEFATLNFPDECKEPL